jgi:hypothetical protein
MTYNDWRMDDRMKRRSAEKPLLGSSTSIHLIGEVSSGMGFPNGDFLCVYFVFTMCLLCIYHVFTMYLLCISYVALLPLPLGGQREGLTQSVPWWRQGLT